MLFYILICTMWCNKYQRHIWTVIINCITIAIQTISIQIQLSQIWLYIDIYIYRERETILLPYMAILCMCDVFNHHIFFQSTYIIPLSYGSATIVLPLQWYIVDGLYSSQQASHLFARAYVCYCKCKMIKFY